MGLFNLFRKPKAAAETSAAQTDTERWLTAANAAALKSILNSDWLVTDHDSGIEMVQYLLDHAGEYWDRIGFVSHEKWALQQEVCSGILHLESYTDEDWIKYGDNIALEQQHIVWLQQVSWAFDRLAYESCVDIYRKTQQWR